MRWAIVADDLTGAADAAVAFADSGIKSTVWLKPPTRQLEDSCAAVDADVRWRSASETAKRVRKHLVPLLASDWVLLKVDSTLRGFVGEMVESVWKVASWDMVVIAPSVPAQGRIVRDGKVFVHGQPLEETNFAKEPPAPASSSDVRERLWATGLKSIPLQLLPLAVVRHPIRLASAIKQAVADKVGLVCDAETQRDLEGIAKAVVRLSRRVLLVGASGLTFALAKATVGKLSRKTVSSLPHCERVLVLVGSQQPVAETQLAYLASRGVPVRKASPTRLPSLLDEPVLAVRWEWTIGEQRASLSQLRRQLRNWVQGWFAEASFNAFVLVGGITARTVLEALGVQRWQLLGSLLPGVPVGMATDEQGRQRVIVTKAGGFGTAETLWQVILRLRGLSDP